MKKSLPLSLSLFCLMGISTLAYGGWTKYVLGDGKMAKGDCLEMLCPHGCVEDDKGNANCCSEGKLGDKCWGELCCQEGLFCSSSTGEGKCVECVKDEDCAGELVCTPDNTCGCPSGASRHTKPDGTLSCCDTVNNILVTIAGTMNKACCPITTPKWDGAKCVQCLMNTDCAGDEYCDLTTKTCKKGCVYGGKTYDNGQAIDTCRVCNNGTVSNVTDGSNKQADGKCCINGLLVYNATLCPEPAKTCSACNECQKCDTTTGQCVADYSKDNQEVQDICHKCSGGSVVLKNTSQTVVCGMQCCQTGYTCNGGVCQAPVTSCTGCSECQICDTTTGQCIADTSKNHQQVQDSCHWCLNGEIKLKNSLNTVPCYDKCCSPGQTCKLLMTTPSGNIGMCELKTTPTPAKNECEGYTMTSCGKCTDCSSCKLSTGATRYKKIGCKSLDGNGHACCKDNSGSCVSCGWAGLNSTY